MWKKLVEKVVQSAAYQKVKLWIEKTGLTNVLYVILAIGAISLPIGGFLRFGLFGAFVGIFVYVNWNVVRKLWKEKIGS
jgi:hypothetical protein